MTARVDGGLNRIDSRQIAYLPVYELVSPLLGDPGLIPGTPSWCRLDDGDPAKWRALLWAAVWWTVNEDARQAARAEASKAISEAADWSQVAREVQQRNEFYAERPYLRREAG